jgi:hypothetical protein
MGISRATVREHIEKLGGIKKPLVSGSVKGVVEVPSTLPTKGHVKRYILTSAQNNTLVNEPFWNNLLALAEHYDAQIMIGTYSYNQNAYGELAVKQGTKKDKDKEKKSKKSRSEATVLRVAAPARGRPQGRYTKREAGKLVKGYSQEDLSMILGVAPADFVAPAAMGATAPSEEAEAEAKLRKKRRRDRSPAAEAPAAAAAAAEEEDYEEQEAWTPPAPDWWGASMFRWAGRLGGIRRASKHDKGFCEDDQVAAYNAVHDGATHGKQGLGVRDAPKKVAGARWAGSKVRFGEEDDAAPEPAPEAAAMRKIKWKVRCMSDAEALELDV